MGGAIKDVLLVDAAGVESGNLEQVSPEQAWRWGESGGRGTGGFVVLGAKVRLLQAPSTTSGSLRIRYYCRRSRLVLVAACGLVSTFNLSADTAPITATPAGGGVGPAVDIRGAAAGRAPHGAALGRGVTAARGSWPRRRGKDGRRASPGRPRRRARHPCATGRRQAADDDQSVLGAALREAMVSRELTLKAAGLYRDPSPFLAPRGALRVAENVVIRRAGLIEPRPGIASIAPTAPGQGI